jgi:hypothetical protein
MKVLCVPVAKHNFYCIPIHRTKGLRSVGLSLSVLAMAFCGVNQIMRHVGRGAERQ